jgi:hypothetical protein
MNAAYSGYDRIAQLLVEYGADIHKKALVRLSICFPIVFVMVGVSRYISIIIQH